MSKLLDFKLIFIAIFLLLTIAIRNCENFQLRDLEGGGSETSKSVASKTKIRFPFRKLEKVSVKNDDEDEDDEDDDEDDDDEDENYVFAKVRSQKFKVEKRDNFRPSKLAQFRDKNTKNNKYDDDDDDDDDDQEEEKSFFSRVISKALSYFKSKPKESASGDDENDKSAEKDDDEDNNNDDENENKPLLVEIYDSFRAFLEASSRHQDRNAVATSDEDDNDDDNDNDTPNEDSKSDDNDSESGIKKTIRKTFVAIFNRTPFNLIFDFDDSDDDDDESEVKTFEDSEEDEINYQKLLKEEREQEEQKTEQLIKNVVEEEVTKEEVKEPESDAVDDDDDEEEEEGEEAKKKPQATPVKKQQQKPKKSKQEVHLAHKEFEKLLLNLPSFVPDYAKVKNPECQKQGEVFQRQLRGQKLWALQMMDANAKIPSGLLRGNVNQLGDFDLCTKISQKIKISDQNTMKMKGKYCLANIDVVAAVDQLKLPVHLMQGRNFIRSSINDPSHFFPRYSTINWGLCLPSACTFNDADHILESFIGPYNSTGIKLHISVDEDSCYMRKSSYTINVIKNDWKVFATCLLILITISATIVSTLNDYLDTPLLSSLLNSKANEGESIKTADSLPNKILSCFSLKKNLPTLISTSESEEIKCIHGLKAISIILLFISIKLIPMGRVPYTNRNKFTEFFNSPLSVFLRSSFLYEDVFLVISGLLASLSVIKEISVSGRLIWFKKVFAKFLRLVLPLAVVLLFYAFLYEHIGMGPQWNLVTKNADLCRDNMWKNLIFIQNFYPFEEMCASHTYHIAVDFQLYLLAPLLVWMVYKNPTIGFSAYGVLHALSSGARFSSTVESRLSTVVFHGMKLSQLYRTFNLSLAVAIHRATPFLIGIALGIAVKEFGKVQLPKGAVMSGWISTVCAFIWCFYKPSNLSHKDYQYDPSAAAQYSALAPLLWSLGIAWIIFACHNDASWKLNCFLSSRAMIFISRISYSTYLIVFLIFFYFSGTLRSSEEFHVFAYLDRMETCIVVISAVLFTLTIDLPTKNLVKFLTNSNIFKSSSTSKEEIVSEEFESPFGNNEEEEEVFVFRPVKSKYNSYDHDENVNGEYVNGKVTEADEKKEEEEEEEKPKATMNARRWKWEVLDD